MKGIAHFISGVTVASFCPWAIEAAQNGNPVYFILGAIAGMFPDTADFKFYRYFYRYDVYVEPGPTDLNPQSIADAVAAAISKAAETGRPVRVKLSTVQLGADNWRQYRVQISSERNDVRVQFGPIVSTGQVPQRGTLPSSRPVGIAGFSASIHSAEKPVYTVDIFDGPGLEFIPKEKGRIEIGFLPWHRSWSHSLPLGLLLAAVAACCTWKASVVVLGAYLAHVIEDQLGHMGSNLFFPFNRKRISGLRRMHSGDALPNFATVWFCGLLIFWNLYAAAPHSLYQFSFFEMILFAFGIPFVVLGILQRRLALRNPSKSCSVEWSI